jgi:membrane protease YdiL (CAAX protease family)
VCIPILFYKLLYNFKLKDWGIYATLKSCLSKRSLFIFVVMASVLFILQLFMGNGAKPVREGLLTSRQFLIGIPLFYLWLVIEVGIVEEFFFRAFLQSRLTALLDSQTGGIVISALLFGLAHAPGIYLRGGGEPANLGTEPGLILSVGYSITVLSIAGIFLSVIWAKTRNFWLIVSIHAFVDLLPGLAGFVETWGIK